MGSRRRRRRSHSGPGPGARPGAEFAWRAHEEPWVYLGAAVSYVVLGVVLQSVALNWIVGPLYFVCFVWASSLLLQRRRGRRR
jgi:hypothetical protein